jgi:hypothetical protein
MKILLWMCGVIGALFMLAVLLIRADPRNSIVGVSTGASGGYTETVVLMRDGTFDQYLTKSSSQETVHNTGTWTDDLSDEGTSSLLSQTETKLSGKYLNLKGKAFLGDLAPGSRSGTSAIVSTSLEPAFSFQTPNDEIRKKIDVLRQKAKPFSKP